MTKRTVFFPESAFPAPLVRKVYVFLGIRYNKIALLWNIGICVLACAPTQHDTPIKQHFLLNVDAASFLFTSLLWVDVDVYWINPYHEESCIASFFS
jgi:hypothetical protein